MTTAPAPERWLIYVADPMCSWCWGFAPVLDTLAERYRIPIEVVVGGLRTGTRVEIVDDQLARFLGHHWEDVERGSGQPFDHHLLDERGWRYDTEPSCRAVVVVRGLDRELARGVKAALQRAFYVDGRHLEQEAVVMEVVGDHLRGLGRADLVDAFEAIFPSAEARARTQADVALAQELGVGGFPTLLLRRVAANGAPVIIQITRGWQPADDLISVLDPYLADNFASVIAGTPGGDACGIDGRDC